MHGISGNLGWATAPVFMAGIATATGSWRTASLCGAAFALLVLAIMVINRDALDDRQGEWAHQAKGAASAQAAKPSIPWPSSTAFGVAVLFVLLLEHLRPQRHPEFASPALHQSMYGLPLSVTAMVVTGYMLCGAAGMVAGGFWWAALQQLEK